MLLNTYLLKVLYILWIFKEAPPYRTEINTLTFGKSYIHKLTETIMTIITQQLDVYNNNRIRVKILDSSADTPPKNTVKWSIPPLSKKN